MSVPLRDLLNALDLTPLKGSKTNNYSDSFEGKNLYIPTNSTYGGLFLSQSLIAAAKTTSEFRVPNSIQAIFIRPGNISFPTTYQVSRLRDGAKYSHRRVDAFQNDELLFSAFVMFHEGEQTGADFQTEKMPQIAIDNPPLSVKSQKEIFSELQNKSEWYNYFANKVPFEQRGCNPNLFLDNDPNAASSELIIDANWARVRPEDVKLFNDITSKMTEHQKTVVNLALIAFISDQFGFAPAIRQGGLSWTIENVAYASLDHTMHFHNHDFDLTNWMLFSGSAPFAKDGRGIGAAKIFTESGKLVATFGQEGLLRTGQSN